MELLKINVPKHLQAMVGSDHCLVAPIHTVGQSLKKGGLVLVYEPRRGCEYWVHQSDIYPPPSKKW